MALAVLIEPQTGARVLCFDDTLDLSAANEVLGELEVAAKSCLGCIIDLAAVRHVADSGLALLLLVHRRAQALGVPIRLVGAREDLWARFPRLQEYARESA